LIFVLHDYRVDGWLIIIFLQLYSDNTGHVNSQRIIAG